MPCFPTREAQIDDLAVRMIRGYQSHATDFPHVTFLNLALDYGKYRQARLTQVETFATVRSAVTVHRQKLKILVMTMKGCLKKARVDVADDPHKLAWIGYGPKATASTVQPAGCPRNLRGTADIENQTIGLSWQNPKTGGSVGHYIIQRRFINAPASEWGLVASTCETWINLTEQPQGVPLEYRILAGNKAGISLPGNEIRIVI